MNGQFVTILFTDIVGSSALFDRVGDDQADAVRRDHFDALRRAIAEHGGREVKSTGDGLMVAFASAVAAVRCAVDMQRLATAADGGLPIRVGLDAGEPLPDGDDLYGKPVIVASRLCESAAGGEILASDVVRQIAGPRLAELMEPAGALRLAGIAERVSVTHVRSAAPRLTWSAARGRTSCSWTSACRSSTDSRQARRSSPIRSWRPPS
jgi:class 3 adenylate cyclase